MQHGSRYLTVNETARELRRSPDTIRRLIASGALRADRITERGPFLVPTDAIDELVKPAARAKAAA